MVMDSGAGEDSWKRWTETVTYNLEELYDSRRIVMNGEGPMCLTNHQRDSQLEGERDRERQREKPSLLIMQRLTCLLCDGQRHAMRPYRQSCTDPMDTFASCDLRNWSDLQGCVFSRIIGVDYGSV